MRLSERVIIVFYRLVEYLIHVIYTLDFIIAIM